MCVCACACVRVCAGVRHVYVCACVGGWWARVFMCLCAYGSKMSTSVFSHLRACEKCIYLCVCKCEVKQYTHMLTVCMWLCNSTEVPTICPQALCACVCVRVCVCVRACLRVRACVRVRAHARVRVRVTMRASFYLLIVHNNVDVIMQKHRSAHNTSKKESLLILSRSSHYMTDHW